MPYIQETSRNKLVPDLIPLLERVTDQGVSEGELNFLLTCLVVNWLGDPNYKALNAAVGVLECVKQELYRRVVVPYEDIKKEENGDVYIE